MYFQAFIRPTLVAIALICIPSAAMTSVPTRPESPRNWLPEVVVEDETSTPDVVVEEPTAKVDVPPRVKATLDTISFAEGTWDSVAQKPDYTVRFSERPGGGTLNTESPHPLNATRSRWYTSNASGAYQFLCTSWKLVNDGRNEVMTPENQDAAAIRLIEQKTYFDFNRPFREQAHRLAGTWASIPTRYGHSAYGQPVKRLDDLDRFYQTRLNHWVQQIT